MGNKNSGRKTHGMHDSKIYICWLSIQQRCNNHNCRIYKNYGGRGIRCERSSFEDFYRDMGCSYEIHNKLHGGRNTSIERINVDGDYCKDNCKRATHKEQNNNKTCCHIVKGKTLQQRSELYGIHKATLRHRVINLGLDVEDAISYERKSKSGIEGIVWSNNSNKRFVVWKVDGKRKTKYFDILEDAKDFKDILLQQ